MYKIYYNYYDNDVYTCPNYRRTHVFPNSIDKCNIKFINLIITYKYSNSVTIVTIQWFNKTKKLLVFLIFMPYLDMRIPRAIIKIMTSGAQTTFNNNILLCVVKLLI